MTHSLNEIGALCKRAARGAGLSWGLAEEAGTAARWLLQRGLPGADLMADLLVAVDGAAADHAPTAPGKEVWQAPKGALCPIHAGAALSDRAEQFPEQGLVLENLLCPVLLAPFLAVVARRRGAGLGADWGRGRLWTDGHGLAWRGPIMDGSCGEPFTVTLCKETNAVPAFERHARAQPSPETLVKLNRLAHRTYAPATEESRQRGAGAGGPDND